MARLRSLEEEARTLESEVQNARAQNAHLADDVRVLRGDDPGSRAMLEKLARDELGYLGKGEVVLVMPSDAR